MRSAHAPLRVAPNGSSQIPRHQTFQVVSCWTQGALRARAGIFPNLDFGTLLTNLLTNMGNGALLGLHDSREVFYEEDAELNNWNHSGPYIPDIGKKKSFAEGYRIEGAMGMYSQHINSWFIRTGQTHNEHMLYQSLSNPDNWLRYTTSGRWMVSTTSHKDKNLSEGFCCCKNFGLPKPSHAKGWFVLDRQGVFRTQTKVQATKMTDSELQQKDVKKYTAENQYGTDKSQLVYDALQDALPSCIKFEGATGLLAHMINGVYKCEVKSHPTYPGRTIEDKKIFYRDSHDPSINRTTLLNDSMGRWVVISEQRVLAYCGVLGLPSPCDASRWHVSNSAQAFSVQLSATVTKMDAKDIKSLNATEIGSNAASFQLDMASFSSSKNSICQGSMPRIVGATRKRYSILSSYSAVNEMRKKLSPYVKALRKMKSKYDYKKPHLLSQLNK